MTFNNTSDYLLALEHDPTLAIISMQMVADVRNVSRAAVDRMLKLGQLQEIRVGTTRCVRASDVIVLQRAKDQQIDTIRRYLEKCAKRRETTTYQPVMSEIGLSASIPSDRRISGVILGEISIKSWNDHKVLLSVLVHRKTLGRTRPGPGFFRLDEVIDDLPSWDDDDEFVDSATKRVWDFYSKHEN
jgi:hypothetical protein